MSTTSASFRALNHIPGDRATHSGRTSALALTACDGTEHAEPGHVDFDDDFGARARAHARHEMRVIARRSRARRCLRRAGAVSERERVGGGERGRVGRGVGTRAADDRATETSGSERQHQPDHDDGDHEDRDAAALGARSRRRSPLDPHGRRRVQVGIREQHADERQVRDGVVLHGDGDLVAHMPGERRRRRSRPGGVRCAARAAAPGSRSTLAARAASRAAWTTPIWSRTTSPTWMTARAASTISGSRKANSTVA